MKNNIDQIPLEFKRRDVGEMLLRAKAFHAEMDRRRTVRQFSPDPVPYAVLEEVVRAASSAPSGAHKQPWTFCVVGDPGKKKQIREAAEEEAVSYTHLRAHETVLDLVCRLLLEKKNHQNTRALFSYTHRHKRSTP